MTEEQEQASAAAETGAKPVEPSNQAVEPVFEAPEWEGKLEAAMKDVETLRDQLKRKAAEFENYKRRIEAEY